MFRKVIVGVATREGDEEAIALARALAPTGELVLVNAYPFDSVPSRSALLAYGNALRHEARHEVEKLRDKAGIPDAQVVVVPDTSPARALQRTAADRHADLIVISSAHHGRLGRILLGDVARSVLHGAPCPVLTVPRGGKARRIRTIGVAFDGSPEARLALEQAAAIATELGARLRALHVIAPPVVPSGVAAAGADLLGMQEELEARARARIGEALDRVAPDVQASGEAVTGPPATLLEDLTAAADLVVIGSRGWGTLRRVVLGSTSDRVIHHAQCPVMVVPRGAAEAETRSTAMSAGARRS